MDKLYSVGGKKGYVPIFSIKQENIQLHNLPLRLTPAKYLQDFSPVFIHQQLILQQRAG